MIRPMSPHRRRCVIRALLEVRGTVSGLTLEKLLKMSGDELLKISADIEKTVQDANVITEPAAGPRLEDLDTIVMEAIDDPDD